MRKKREFSPKRKNKIKVIRTIIQFILIILLAVIIIRSLFTMTEYEPYDSTKVEMASDDEDPGFITLSYFGVDRTQEETLISTERLDQHLKALYDNGYVTITQQDVLDYYQKKKKLPKKSLFLLFEDGRRDTAIFAEKVLEKYNFKATLLTYANKFEDHDPKFVSFSDLEELEKSSYWEMGTNGYRLSYINCFDRHGNFLNCLDILKFQLLNQYMERDYDHYLMDFIRDENSVPMETLGQLEDRLGYDYTLMQDVYKEGMGSLPQLYILMHSNTGRFGSSEKASAINEEWIYKLFKMNYNREGDCLSNHQNSIYDLTRVQPQANWYTNHVLMRIWDDTKQNIQFVSGDEQHKQFWNTPVGQSEFQDDTIILTSLPDARGLMTLKQQVPDNVRVDLNFNGNVNGSQSVYLRMQEDEKAYIKVEVKDNIMYVYEKTDKKKAKKLYELDLDDLDGIIHQSWSENKKEAETEEIKVDLKYAETIEEGKEKAGDLKQREEEEAKSVTEGAISYIPKVSTTEVGKRHMDITLKQNKLTVKIDQKVACENISVSVTKGGSLALEAKTSDAGFSQRNLADDVYDGVFDKLFVSELSLQSSQKDKIIYDNRLRGLDAISDGVKDLWEYAVNWFIRNL